MKVPWTQTNVTFERVFKFLPKAIFTASDWSRPVFYYESDTDVVERRLIARNFSLDLSILAKNGHFGIPGVNFKSRQNHTIWGSFESSLVLENGKNNEKNFPSKNGAWAPFG